MSTAAHPDFADIDAAIARGEWWMTLFDALSDAGMTQVRALRPDSRAGMTQVVQRVCGLVHAVCLAIVAAMRLDHILRGLADLRRLAPEAIADAMTRARARAEHIAAARARARDKARAKREALKVRARDEDAADLPDCESRDRETLDRKETALLDRDSVIEALDRRLTVDPAGVDFDALPLRRTVERICAALGVAPDWRRWEAGDWTMGGPPANQTPSGPQASPPANRRAVAPLWRALPELPGFTPRKTDTALVLVLAAGSNAPPWPPPPA